VVLAACAALAVLLYRPPRVRILLGLLLLLGLGMRLVYLALYSIDPQRADNMEMIRRRLALLVAGHTPYAFQDFGTHTTALTYLPWTVFSYLPPFLLGLD